jgi:hypothetical protein
MTPHSLSKPALAAGAALLITLLAAGCAFQTVREQQAKIAALCTISGTVRTERPTTNPLIVALVRQRGAGDLEQPANWDLFDHFVVEGSGSWHFLVSPGTYGLAAFEDRDSNLVYRPGEPFLGVDPNRLIACGRGGERRDIALVIPTEGKPRIGGEIDISKLQARTVHDQFAISIGLLTTVGEVTTLDDPRFSEENAKSGMWAPLDFTLKFRPGVYFLQPYERDRIPVLFVHGIEGTPATFRYLIGRLDRTRFQPWVYYYPSGASLGFTADHLTETMRNLQLEHLRGRPQHGRPGFARVHPALSGPVAPERDSPLRDDRHAVGRGQIRGAGREVRPGGGAVVVRHGAGQRLSTRALLSGPRPKDPTHPAAVARASSDVHLQPQRRILRPLR